MACGMILSKTEENCVENLKKDGNSNRKITKLINCSAKSINNSFKNKLKKNPAGLGRKIEISDREKRTILRAVSDSTHSIRKINRKNWHQMFEKFNSKSYSEVHLHQTRKNCLQTFFNSSTRKRKIRVQPETYVLDK